MQNLNRYQGNHLYLCFQIVWDDVNKRWVNTDGDDADNAPAAPPPKDSELSGLCTKVCSKGLWEGVGVGCHRNKDMA